MEPREDIRIETCPDCDGLSRRSFLWSVGTAAAAVGTAGLPLGAGRALAAVRPGAAAAGDRVKPAETYVKALYDALTAEQRALVCMPFDHAKRSHVDNNWHIVDPKEASIGTLYTPDQKEIIRLIFKGVTSEDGYERFMKQMKDDAGGFDNYTCAIFGEPGTHKFEWVMTGRHLTIRADGDSVENTAFGGPIFYGHAVEFNEKPDHPGNVWWHQARLANQVFQSLDGTQREKALLPDGPPDNPSSVELRGASGGLSGLPGAEMSADQKKLLEETLRSLLSMYRESDVREVTECLKKNGGLDRLRMSFYKEGDTGDDGVWDRWRVEGPAFVWYFRGSPHVHTWVHIAHGAPGEPAATPRRAKV